MNLKRKQVIKSVKGILLGIVAFILVTMSLFHVFFAHKSKEYVEHRKTYSGIIKQRDSNTFQLIDEFNKEISTIKDRDSILDLANLLSIKYREHFENSNKELQAYNLKKANLAKAHTFRGRTSFRIWIFMFGLVTLGLFFSCKSLYHDINQGSTYRAHFLSLSGIFVSIFWVIHLVFLTQEDFSESSYLFLLSFCALLCTVFTYFLVKYYSYKDEIIKGLINFIVKVKTIHIHELGVKSLFAERVGVRVNKKDKKVGDILNEFDSDLKEAIKDL